MVKLFSSLRDYNTIYNQDWILNNKFVPSHNK